MRRLCLSAAVAAVSLAASFDALAHVTLETQQAVAGSTYKAVLRVGHGCDGSPTTAIRVRIPEGMIAVKPMPKPGWELTTKEAPYAKPVQYFESTLTSGVAEIAWTGGSLPDAVWTQDLGLPSFVVPYGVPDQRNHAPNENMPLDRFYAGIRTSAALLAELSRA